MTIIYIPALAIALLAFSTPGIGQTVGCQGFFVGGEHPAIINPKLAVRTTLLCNDGYASLNSGVTRGALWSAERLTSTGIEGARGLPRHGQFHADQRLPPSERAELEDYRQSGYDRGHMAPSGDMPDERAQQQSFSLANMVPQNPTLNRGAWSKIEERVRRMAESQGELYVVTGPAFVGAQISSIGPDGVLVPSFTWKAVYDPVGGGTGAYVCSNTDKPTCEIVPVDTIVRVVGIDPFPALPAAVKAAATVASMPGVRRPTARARTRREPEAASLLDRLFGR